jgi:hypothetical protein
VEIGLLHLQPFVKSHFLFVITVELEVIKVVYPHPRGAYFIQPVLFGKVYLFALSVG